MGRSQALSFQQTARACVDLSVECSCWEKGLCRTCPVDGSLLLPFTVDRRAHGVKPGIANYEATCRTYQAWKETACEHRFGEALVLNVGSPDDLWEIRKVLHPLLHEGSLLLESLRDASDAVYHFDPNFRAPVLHDEAIQLLDAGSVPAAVIGAAPLGARGLVAGVARACIMAVVHQKGLLWY
jgi:hypothetical protein